MIKICTIYNSARAPPAGPNKSLYLITSNLPTYFMSIILAMYSLDTLLGCLIVS